jgi:peptidoglycan/LPS O-acetylase OafA/YrhL
MPDIDESFEGSAGIIKPEFGSRLAVLDGWRAFSILFVIAGHLAIFSSIGGVRPLNLFINSFAPLGVKIFFFISGFVICRGLLKEKQQSGSVSFLTFYIRRACRILPPVTLYLLTVLGAAYLGWVHADLLSLARGFTFTCNFGACGGWFGGHLWTLSSEEQFYLGFPLLFLPLLSHPKVAGVLLSVGIPFAALMLYALHLTPAASFVVESVQFIALGVICAIYESSTRRAAERAPGWLFALAAFFMAIVDWLPAGKPGTVALLFLAPAIAFVVLRSLSPTFILRRLFLSEPVQYVGRISYSLYLWQQLATYAYPHAGYLFYACAIASAFVIASASWFGVEKPLIALGKAFSREIQRYRLVRLQRADA